MEPQIKLAPADFMQLIERKDWFNLRAAVAEMNAADVSEALIELPHEAEAIVFRLLTKEHAADVFSYLPPEHQGALISSLAEKQMRQIIVDIDPDDRARLFDELPASVTRRLLQQLPAAESHFTSVILGYPEDAAGRFMTSRYLALKPSFTAAEALAYIRAHGEDKETLNILYLLDDEGRLLDDVRLSSIVMAEPGTLLSEIEDPPVVTVKPTDDREVVVATFEKYDRIALPVVDDKQHMLGIITVDDVLDAAEAEATEDIHKMGAVEALDAPYLSLSIAEMLRKRGAWLAILFVGEMFTATAMTHFEDEIARAVVLALFVPLIISSGGNSGSQGTSLLIRALALRELRLRDWFRVFRREFITGLSLGAFLGAIGFARVEAWQWLGFSNYGQHHTLIALTVFLSLVGVVTFGTITGSMLPFLLRRVGLDPATSSAPFVATLVDVTGLVIYFTIAHAILTGTLL